MPPSVESLIAARIDRLEDPVKELLQTAAVVGTHFDEQTLHAVTGQGPGELAPHLGRLVQLDFLHEREAYPRVEYGFRDRLTQEVAYRSQLRDRRRGIHVAAAGALERLDPRQVDTRAALIAHHWLEGDRPDEALGWHRRAAQWASRTHPQEAQAQWQRVRELGASLPPTPERMAWGLEARSQLLMLASRIGVPSDEVKALLREGREIADESGNDALRVTLLLLAWFALSSAGHSAEARATAAEALERADATGIPGLQAQARLAVVQGFVGIGSMEDGLAHCAEIEALDRRSQEAGTGPAVPPYRLHLVRGNFVARLGRGQEGLADLEAAVAGAAEADDPTWVQIASCMAATCCWLLGDGEGALAHAERAREIAERTGTPGDLAMAYRALGQGRLAREEWQPAAEILARGLEVARRAGTLTHEELLLENLAQARLGAGDVTGALACAEEASAIAAKRGNDNLEMPALLIRARCLVAQSAAPDRIRANLARVDDLIESAALGIYRPEALLARAELAALEGDAAARDAHLRDARERLHDIGAGHRARRLEENPP